MRTGINLTPVSGRAWEGPAQRVRPPYMKAGQEGWNPEYHETRETLWEAGWTTIQGKILLSDR